MASGLVPKTSKTLNCLVNSTLYSDYDLEDSNRFFDDCRIASPRSCSRPFEEGQRNAQFPSTSQHCKQAPGIWSYSCTNTPFVCARQNARYRKPKKVHSPKNHEFFSSTPPGVTSALSIAAVNSAISRCKASYSSSLRARKRPVIAAFSFIPFGVRIYA